MDFYGSIELLLLLFFDFTAGDFTLLHGSFKFLAHIRGSFHVRFKMFPPLVIISGVFCCLFSLSPSLSLTPRNITTVQTRNTPPMTPAAIMYASFCRDKEEEPKNTCTSVVGRSVGRSRTAAAVRLYSQPFPRSLIHQRPRMPEKLTRLLNKASG